ncbi:MAG: DUF5317 domain-containing protein [Actinomycetota bacterium]
MSGTWYRAGPVGDDLCFGDGEATQGVVELALVVAVVATIAGLLRGGSLEALASTRFRAPWLLFAGLALQVAFDLWSPSWMNASGALAVVLSSNAFVLAWLWLNRRLPGVLLAAVGLALNVVVIASNQAMPVSLHAIEAAGGEATSLPRDLKHEPAGSDTILPWLGDVIPMPVVGTVISVGDVVLAAGVGVLAYRRTTGETQEAPTARSL